jgi:hypothetical protein
MAAAAGLGLLPAAPLLPATDSIEGVVELIEKGVPAPGAAGAVIWYEPEGGAQHAAPRAAEISTR